MLYVFTCCSLEETQSPQPHRCHGFRTLQLSLGSLKSVPKSVLSCGATSWYWALFFRLRRGDGKRCSHEKSFGVPKPPKITQGRAMMCNANPRHQIAILPGQAILATLWHEFMTPAGSKSHLLGMLGRGDAAISRAGC